MIIKMTLMLIIIAVLLLLIFITNVSILCYICGDYDDYTDRFCSKLDDIDDDLIYLTNKIKND